MVFLSGTLPVGQGHLCGLGGKSVGDEISRCFLHGAAVSLAAASGASIVLTPDVNYQKRLTTNLVLLLPTRRLGLV